MCPHATICVLILLHISAQSWRRGGVQLGEYEPEEDTKGWWGREQVLQVFTFTCFTSTNGTNLLTQKALQQRAPEESACNAALPEHCNRAATDQRAPEESACTAAHVPFEMELGAQFTFLCRYKSTNLPTKKALHQPVRGPPPGASH